AAWAAAALRAARRAATFSLTGPFFFRFAIVASLSAAAPFACPPCRADGLFGCRPAGRARLPSRTRTRAVRIDRTDAGWHDGAYARARRAGGPPRGPHRSGRRDRRLLRPFPGRRRPGPAGGVRHLRAPRVQPGRRIQRGP